ncbi:hypothetical protein V1517DRAFT_42692 [Lipomyces orientalis]|uniref:Uncharacterized protein n=1 Tax=Lipomyces orientalis TaxID=1233043 RepID=A0ACC3TFF6_9ASCO
MSSQQFVNGTFTAVTNDASLAVAPVMSPACGKRSVLDLFRLDSRVAVITGGTRGVGYFMGLWPRASTPRPLRIATLDQQSDLGERHCEQLHSDYGELRSRCYFKHLSRTLLNGNYDRGHTCDGVLPAWARKSKKNSPRSYLSSIFISSNCKYSRIRKVGCIWGRQTTTIEVDFDRSK